RPDPVAVNAVIAIQIAAEAARMAYQEMEVERDFGEASDALRAKIDEIKAKAALDDLHPATKPVVEARIKAAHDGEGRDDSGFAQEMADTYTGMVYLDDDATIVGMTVSRLVDLMYVLGYLRQAKPAPDPTNPTDLRVTGVLP